MYEPQAQLVNQLVFFPCNVAGFIFVIRFIYRCRERSHLSDFEQNYASLLLVEYRHATVKFNLYSQKQL